MATRSSSSTEPLAPGATVAGFRVERVLGRGRYEATQLSLDRRVTLEIRPRLGALPADLYVAGECEHGYFVATPLAARRRSRLWLVCAALAAAGTAAWLVVPRSDVPAPARGAQVLGSALPRHGVRSVDCAGQAPSGASRACTLVQAALPGVVVVVPADGVIRAWTVRGARGDLALSVVRGRYGAPQGTPFRHLADDGVHRFTSDLRVRAGDRVGVELAPGAAIGVRRAAGALALRFSGPLRSSLRRPDRRPPIGPGDELLVRFELVSEDGTAGDRE